MIQQKPNSHQNENPNSKKMLKPLYLMTFGFLQIPTARKILKFVFLLYFLLLCIFVVAVLLTFDGTLLIQNGGVVAMATHVSR